MFPDDSVVETDKGEKSKKTPKKSKRANSEADLDFSNPGTWEALAGLWPIEDRPEVYRNKVFM